MINARFVLTVFTQQQVMQLLCLSCPRIVEVLFRFMAFTAVLERFNLTVPELVHITTMLLEVGCVHGDYLLRKRTFTTVPELVHIVTIFLELRCLNGDCLMHVLEFL